MIPKERGKKKTPPTVRQQVKQIKTEIGEDWVIDSNIYEEQDEEYDDKKAARVYLNDFSTNV